MANNVQIAKAKPWTKELHMSVKWWRAQLATTTPSKARLSIDTLNKFENALSSLLEERLQGHWHPENPIQGQALRFGLLLPFPSSWAVPFFALGQHEFILIYCGFGVLGFVAMASIGGLCLLLWLRRSSSLFTSFVSIIIIRGSFFWVSWSNSAFSFLPFAKASVRFSAIPRGSSFAPSFPHLSPISPPSFYSSHTWSLGWPLP